MQVSFILPLYNQLELTQACLDSLRATVPAGLAHEIILVDDGSTDRTREMLRDLGPPHVVLLNDRNRGFAAANNRAARVAQGEFLALLNNDLVLGRGWLDPMLAAFAAYPKAGVVGNIQLDAETGAVDHAGVVFRNGGYPVHYRAGLDEIRSLGAIAEFPAVTAACCLVRREWFLRQGGFDEGYRNGFEDTDLCLRARDDGFANLLATASVVRHHVSGSEGRSDHEFRNARRFLARWGPRTAALEEEWNLRLARERAAAEAGNYFAPFHRRLGLGNRSLRRSHRRALNAVRRSRAQGSGALRIGVDLLRLQPGGANGGVKPFVLSFLAEIGRQRGAEFNFAVLAPASLRAELAAVLRPRDFVIEPAEAPSGGPVPIPGVARTPRPRTLSVHRRDRDGWRANGELPVSDATLAKAGIDVLYAPFGTSEFLSPEIPSVSLIVDLLHRDLPAALSVEEVNHRHARFAEVARTATYFQCNSRHVVERLGHHYGVPPARCFHTYNAVQGRLPDVDAPLPDGAPHDPFFFYPANFWPHKNHEALLVAYRLYAQAAGSRAWPLVFTGHPDERMAQLREMSDGLGLAERVAFLGHVTDEALVALWKRAGALVFPSLCEGFGMPLLEAMRFGVPIIAATASALPEVAGDAALLVDARDPQALAETMRRVAIRTDVKDALVARGHARLSAFSLELEAGRLAHFLASAARRQTP
ncbi:MAG: glycosyl transferase group 1 [Verrucomicrobia bacterium]|nr:glycosyl transferase group 1 [Verrucomicrobiota bacterium]